MAKQNNPRPKNNPKPKSNPKTSRIDKNKGRTIPKPPKK